MKTKILILVLILSVFGTWTMVWGQGDEEEVRMDTSAYETLRRPAALFDHDTHNEAAELEDCAICHHVWEDGTLVEDESSEDSPCSECHGLVPGPENSMSLSNAFHTQCRSCHITTGKGPLLCGECHKKE